MTKPHKIALCVAASILTLGAVGAAAVGTNFFRGAFAWDNFNLVNPVANREPTAGLDYAYDEVHKTAEVNGFGEAYAEPNVVIPDTVTKGGQVYKVTKLEIDFGYDMIRANTLYIGKNVADAEILAYGDTDLKKIEFSAENENDVVFDFSNLVGLVEAVLPQKITALRLNAFCGDSSLQKVEIPETVTSIGDSAFQQCSSLKTIAIPDAVTSIGVSAFMGSGLESISAKSDELLHIGAGAFQACGKLKKAEFGINVNTIDDYVFKGDTALKSLILNSESVLDLNGTQAFQYCYNVAVYTKIAAATAKTFETSVPDFAALGTKVYGETEWELDRYGNPVLTAAAADHASSSASSAASTASTASTGSSGSVSSTSH